MNEKITKGYNFLMNRLRSIKLILQRTANVIKCVNPAIAKYNRYDILTPPFPLNITHVILL